MLNGISIAPGIIFTATDDKFNNYIRINAAFWSARVEQALETLGGLAEAMIQGLLKD